MPTVLHRPIILALGLLSLVAGVQPEAAPTPPQIVESANGINGTFEGMADARAQHTATLLSGGQVLVVGGRDDKTRPLASAEVYDPTTGT